MCEWPWEVSTYFSRAVALQTEPPTLFTRTAPVYALGGRRAEGAWWPAGPLPPPTLTWPSALAVANLFPSGENRTQLTKRLWSCGKEDGYPGDQLKNVFYDMHT